MIKLDDVPDSMTDAEMFAKYTFLVSEDEEVDVNGERTMTVSTKDMTIQIEVSAGMTVVTTFNK